MSLSINLGNWNSVFAVPSAVVDKHIKLAGSTQLKVLLFALRHAGENLTAEAIASELSMLPADVKDAMGYWIETKLISKTDDTIIPSKADLKFNETVGLSDKVATVVTFNKQDKKINQQRQISRPQKPDPIFVAERINSSSEINYMMQEAQVILSRPISNSDSATLLMMHDTDGLPVDVILMLLSYAVSIGKQSMRYIEKVAISWGYEEIDTIEKAEEKIRHLEKSKQAWSLVEKTLGFEKRSPTEKENEAASRWINDWHMTDELIKEAYDRCVNAKGKYILNYMDSIIKRWFNTGIKTLEAAEAERKFSKSKNFGQEKNQPSYDIDNYFESMDTFA